MANQSVRKIIKIDEDKCDGCGQCAPNCAEGAIRIINGKAKLLAENLCDGLGACLGTCPRDAITIEERAADDFDEHAVQKHLHRQPAATVESHASHGGGHGGGGCPGSRLRMLQTAPSSAASPAADSQNPPRRSQLGQWPVQLALVPTSGPVWQDADVLIAADCVPFAYPDFHEKLLAGKRLAIACPKLDDMSPYVQKLAAIFANNTIKSITVAHMEVPCCSGIVRAVQVALTLAQRPDIPVHDVTVKINGTIQ